jgi:starvation-inducible DNA-binding protein
MNFLLKDFSFKVNYSHLTIFNMTDINPIGLEVEKTTALAERLNDLLANYQIFYMNARGFHWNISGEKFFELHVKFEELYTDALVKVDEIGERILTLGFTPTHSFSDYIKNSSILESTNVSSGHEAVEAILSGLKTLIIKERALLKLSEESNDEGTNALMSDYIREQEKSVWMYTSYLSVR